MSQQAHVKATHKSIQTYYQTLKDYREHDVGHETALRSAFQNLLAEIAKTRLTPSRKSRTLPKPSKSSRTAFPIWLAAWLMKSKPPTAIIPGSRPLLPAFSPCASFELKKPLVAKIAGLLQKSSAPCLESHAGHAHT
jgi:hypothetical protein